MLTNEYNDSDLSLFFIVVVEKVNECIASPDRGRLFAIVLVAKKQYKVTDHDLIQTSGFMVGADVGDRIRLEKVSFFINILICNY